MLRSARAVRRASGFLSSSRCPRPCVTSPSSSSSSSSSAFFATTSPTTKAPPPPLSSITHPHPRINRLLREYLSKMNEGPPPAATLQPPGQAREKLPKVDRIFVNNSINLGQIDVLGMDYDYTLCGYTHQLEALIYNLAREYLIEHGGYPAEIRQRDYDPSFAIRGLAVDLDRGWLLKLSYIQQVALRTVFSGRRRLKKHEVLADYGDSGHVSPQYRNEHLKALLDLFSMSEACLLANVLDHLDVQGMHHDPRAVVEDVLKAVNYVHMSGKMHSAVVKDLPTYMLPAPHLRETLTRFRDVGKKLFLCSNSNYEYVSSGMRFLLGDDWQDLFDVTIVSAGKPGFYTSDRPFRSVSRATGRIRWTEVTKLEKGKVYSHGSMEALTKMTGWKGPRVLYIGDQVFADLVGARRNQGWRTGAVIRELEHELLVQSSREYRAHAHKMVTVTELLRLIQEEMEKIRAESLAGASSGKGTAAAVRCKYSLEEGDLRVINDLEQYLQHLNTEMSIMFNKNFGSVFRAEGEPTLFAFSMRRYVDIYMSRLENLRFYSPMHRFYPQRGVSMAHDPYVPAIVRPTLVDVDEEVGGGGQTAGQPSKEGKK